MSATAEKSPPETARTSDPRESLDAEKRAAVILLLKLGYSRRMAARQVGCCHTTIARSAARDAHFGRQVALAETHADTDALQMIQDAMHRKQNWRAAAWLLERRNPEVYGRRRPFTFGVEQVLGVLEMIYARAIPALKDEEADEFLAFVEDFMEDVEEQAQRAKPAPRGSIGPFSREPTTEEDDEAADESVESPMAANDPNPIVVPSAWRPKDLHQSCPTSRAERKQLERRKRMAAKELQRLDRSAPLAAQPRGGAYLGELLAQSGKGRASHAATS